MRKFPALLAFVLILGLSGPAFGQGPGRGAGMGPWAYDPQTVTTVTGQVESVPLPGGARARRGMMNITLKTDQGSLEVHLGPFWYLDQQQVELKAGDRLEVTGSQATRDGRAWMVAREFKLNGKTVTLRDEQGLPLWRGRGMGPGRGKGGL